MWYLDGMFSTIYINGSCKQNKKLAKYKNMERFRNVFMQLVNEALQRYYIEGLPDTCSQRVVLESLLWYGSVIFFRKDGQILALPGAPANSPTLYGEMAEAYVWGRNGFNEKVKLYIPHGDNSELVRSNAFGQVEAQDGTGVWVRENYMAYPFIYYVMQFAYDIADSYRTLDVVRQNIKKPFVVTAEESVLQSVKTFFEKRDNNEEYIVSSGVFPSDKITINPISSVASDGIRDVTNNISQYYAWFRELEAISAMGATIDKKAEITTDELYQNSGLVDIVNGTVENVIQEQLEYTNAFLGTNMKFVSRVKKVNDDQKAKVNAQAEKEADNENV